MSNPRTQRVRDPVHGLIAFRAEEPVDQLAWRLLDTPEFQRLRRIRQLGVSEFVFPSATHTRFAHCIGVFHTARTLVRIIERELRDVTPGFDKTRANVAMIAALLHDLGHGPFSHTFEGVQKARGEKRRHEAWTADIIRNQAGQVRPLLEEFAPDFCEAVAALLEAEDPADIYHAVVSSSFDADRLDYLRRDRLMTGTGAGAIDFDWLMEHVRVRDIVIDAPEAENADDSGRVPTFCFDSKALPAAEQFLLARYTLHEQVYFHKTTRGIEKLIERLLRRVAELATKPKTSRQTGLDKDHPLIRFFAPDGATVGNYLALDDLTVTNACGRLRNAPDAELANIASRLLDRRFYKSLDIGTFGYDEGSRRKAARHIDKDFQSKVDHGQVIKDDGASISIYTQIGGDDERAHKKLHILDAKGPVEISDVSDIIKQLKNKKNFLRYYFADDEDRQAARQLKGSAS